MTEEGFGPDFAATFRTLMLDVIGPEAEATARVLAAVPDDQRDYRPAPESLYHRHDACAEVDRSRAHGGSGGTMSHQPFG